MLCLQCLSQHQGTAQFFYFATCPGYVCRAASWWRISLSQATLCRSLINGRVRLPTIVLILCGFASQSGGTICRCVRLSTRRCIYVPACCLTDVLMECNPSGNALYRYRCIQRNQKPESWQGAHARSARSARSIESPGGDDGGSDSDDGMIESGWTAEEIAE